nr:hypothetical protein [Pyrinomonadaceae bacterium]
RTGYSDGYMSGYRDVIENSAKNYSRHGEYTKADRAYNKDYGVLEEYRDGYQQGFESGYDTGFEKRSFDATLPIELKIRGVRTLSIVEKPAVEEKIPAEIKPEITENVAASTNSNLLPENSIQTPVVQNQVEKISYRNDDEAVIIIPTDTELILELIDHLSTEQNREGDKFKARIISPAEISGAVVEGRISKIRRPVRLKRRSEMHLSFDRIVVNEKRWSNFNAILTEVLPVRGDNVKLVDTEGTAVGKRNIKEDSVKVGAATGTGIVIGAIAGGPVGAAVGAGVGAAFGVGAVVIERGKNINLNRNQQLRIKTSYETQIR